ncbi:hypothetical protein Tco_1537948, partial [Tanacetum coccineum]
SGSRLDTAYPRVGYGVLEISWTQEVKGAMFSMSNDKSPGPDGFTAAFFKEIWDIVASDVVKAV